MRITLSAAEQEFRERLCATLQAELSPEARAAHHDPDQPGGWSAAFSRDFQRRLGAGGFIGAWWPVSYGGDGGGTRLLDLLVREIEYHRGPTLDSGTLSYLPPSLLRYGSEAQKQEFLPRLARGEIAFFVGYSEAEAGSDLAGLQARATAQGDTFTLRGQKMFSSGAHMADFGWVAARTDPAAPKHRGISIFIVNMSSPGITITASRTIGGWLHHAVYFDDVEVRRSRLVGEENGGWRLIRGAIDSERAILASPGGVEAAFDLLLAHAAPLAAGDTAVAERLARLAVEVEAATLATTWLQDLREGDRLGQYESALALIMKREAVRAVEQAAIDLLGVRATLSGGSPLALAGGVFAQEYQDHLYYHFAAGGFDISRNVVATRGLDLPR